MPNRNYKGWRDGIKTDTTMTDSLSLRPRKIRRSGIKNKAVTVVRSSLSSPSSDNFDPKNKIINLVDDSEISLVPIGGLLDVSSTTSSSAAIVDLTNYDEEEDGSHLESAILIKQTWNNDEDDRKQPGRHLESAINIKQTWNDDEDDRKQPARVTTDRDIDHRSDDEWSCPQCTLINKEASVRCGACQHLYIDLENRSDPSICYTSEQPIHRRDQQPISTTSLGFIGSGALRDAAVGMAGNLARGRDQLSGAFEGGSTGAVGGTLLHETLQNNNLEPEIATATTNVGYVAYTRRNNDASNMLSTRRSLQSGEGRSSLRSNIRIPFFQPLMSTGAAEYSNLDSWNEHMNLNTDEDANSSNIRLRPRNPNRHNSRFSNTNSGDRESEASLNLIPQFQMFDNEDGASFRGFERGTRSELSNQFLAMQLSREWNTLSRSNANSIDAMTYEQLLDAFGDGTENMGAEEEAIRRLPNHVVGDKPLPKDARQCLICLEDFEKGESRTILPCLHGFHQNCCHKWLLSNGKCPVCKHPISASG